MNIKIYTYSDPYSITSEPYWSEIEKYPQFCASHTMANGLMSVYNGIFRRHQVSTVNELVNSLYYDWEKTNKKVMQLMETDNVINSLSESEEVKRALAYNMKSISQSIRMFSELGLKPENIKRDKLSCDQNYLYQIYKSVCERENSYFVFERVNEYELIDEAIRNALTGNSNDMLSSDINCDSIIIHGVFQFSPAIMAAIEDISRFKNIIFLINYQQQYEEIYSPWIRIYSEFDRKIHEGSNTVQISQSKNEKSNIINTLADSIGKMYNGLSTAKEDVFDNIEVIEFENTTEFAGYIATMYDEAVQEKNINNSQRAVLSFMPEKFYSTSSDINNLLRSYFPEQFGERHFLDYPVGHFFVSAVEMWDNESETIRFEGLAQLKECLTAGILKEEYFGKNINTFNQISAFIDGETTLDGVLSRMKTLKKCIRNDNPDRKRIEYFQVTKKDLTELIEALEQLKEIIEYFFSDFNDGGDNFRRFYKKIGRFISNEIQNNEKFDEDMHDITNRLLSKLNTSDLPDTGTMVCLKETLTYYLSQEESVYINANRIVNDFEQIDGDILKSDSTDDGEICFHFCQLSDSGVCSAKSDSLPWPLDLNFFNEACTIIDWKYFVFLRSKMEQKYFKRYSFVYGLQFLRNADCKLSYVKNENGKENDIYFMLKLLNIKTKKYIGEIKYHKTPQLSFDISSVQEPEYNKTDERRWNICKYRFAIESLIQNKTVYRNKYLIHQYIAILLENDVLRQLKNMVYNENEVRDLILESYDALDTRFKISDEFSKTSLIYSVMKNISRRFKKFKILKNIDENILSLKEDLLNAFVEENAGYKNISEIITELKETDHFDYSLSQNCSSCSCKDVCLQYNFDD